MSNPKIITSAPYFQVCKNKKCGRHGRIVIPSRGQESKEILTKRGGVESAEYAVQEGLIKSDESPELIRQINFSTVPNSDPDINIIFCEDFIRIRYEETKEEEPETADGEQVASYVAPANVTYH